MAQTNDPARCFSCGGPSNQLNEIEEGVNCPACAERLLEDLPGIFHEPWSRKEDAVEASDEAEEVEMSRPRGPRPIDPPHGGGDDAA